MAVSLYGDIPEESGIYLSKPFLERAKPKMILGSFAFPMLLPNNNSRSVKARRYKSITVVVKPMVEGVTPESLKVTVEDVYFTLQQYGNYLELTDVVELTHEDQVLQEFSGLLGEHGSELIEKIRLAYLNSGTSVFYANGTSRSGVTDFVTKKLLRNVEAALKVNRAQRHTRMIRSTNAFGTEAIKPAYVGVCHPYMTKDIEDIDGFIPVEKYGSLSPWDNEIGAVGAIRFIEEDLVEPWKDAGGDVSGTTPQLSTSGSKCDVYPLLVFGRDAYADVPLKGYSVKNADNKGNMVVPVRIIVLKPDVPRGGDPLGQRGSVGYKLFYACGILNDPYIFRVEAAVSA